MRHLTDTPHVDRMRDDDDATQDLQKFNQQ